MFVSLLLNMPSAVKHFCSLSKGFLRIQNRKCQMLSFAHGYMQHARVKPSIKL